MLRLRELRMSYGMNMKETAEAFGLHYTTYIHYEKGTREASMEQLRKFADYYHVTLDYLLGRSDDPLSGLPEESERQYASPSNVSAAAYHIAALYELANPRDKQLVETILSAYEQQYYGK